MTFHNASEQFVLNHEKINTPQRYENFTEKARVLANNLHKNRTTLVSQREWMMN